MLKNLKSLFYAWHDKSFWRFICLWLFNSDFREKVRNFKRLRYEAFQLHIESKRTHEEGDLSSCINGLFCLLDEFKKIDQARMVLKEIEELAGLSRVIVHLQGTLIWKDKEGVLQ